MGVRTTSTPSVANTSSKGLQNLVSRSWMRNRSGRARWSRSKVKFLACWVTHPPSGLVVQPARWTRLVVSSMNTRTKDPFEPHGFDGEEIARHHARSLLGQELPPRRGTPPGSRPRAAACEQFSDRASRDLDTELLELAPDALVSPSRVLCREAQDQLLQLCRQWRPPRASLAVSIPLEADHLPVPTQHSLRRYEEASPAGPWQSSSRSGEKCPV